MKTTSQPSGLSSIKNRILIFSILVTLVPSFGMGWFFYNMTYRAMAEKNRQRLVDSTQKVEREMTFWFADRANDLKIFADSFVLIDNLARHLGVDEGGGLGDRSDQTVSPAQRIATYLDFVRKRYPDYKGLAVFDPEGREIAASRADGEPPFSLPADWKTRIKSGKAFVGKVSFYKGVPLSVIGIPLISGKSNKRLGVLAIRVNLEGLAPFLKHIFAGSQPGPWSVRLVRKDGQPILAMSSPEGQTDTALSSSQQLKLFAHPQEPMNFSNKKWVVGFAAAFKNLPLGLVTTESYDYVYTDVIHLRDRIILTAIIFTLCVGLGVSIVARRIILPLQSLTRGVLRVANGDLDTHVDIVREDELGIVTGMFNEMVMRLKQNKEALEQLAVTDPLTKLVNRKQIMKSIAAQVENFRRYNTPFSLLMVDIDHFKLVNDTHGHLVGDAVLVQLALIFNKMLRTMDVAGRYGGEEFLMILAQTDGRQAAVTAERIRETVEGYPFVYEDVELHITVSVGVAGINDTRDTDNSLIARADAALYEAKAAGRNTVVLSGSEVDSKI